MSQKLITKHIGKNTIEADILEEKDRKTTPERRIELQNKIDYFFYGENTHRNYEKAKQPTTY